MICPKCGREIPDGTVCPCSVGTPMLSSNPAVNVIKKIGSSPLFLTAVILYSVTLVLTFISSITAGSAIPYYAYSFMESYGYGESLPPSVYYSMMDASSGATAFGAILGLIPSILIAVGMWITWATCRSTTSGNISTAGLTICKVISIITLVLLCIVAAIFVVACFVLIFAGAAAFSSDSYYSSYAAGATAGLVFVVILCAAVFALMIAYYASIVRTINRIKTSAMTGVPEYRISRFLTTLMWITAVLSCISGLVALFTSFISGVATLASAVCTILLAVCLGQLRKEMSIVAFPAVQPVYPVQPVQPGYPQQPVAPNPVQPAVPAEPVRQPIEPAVPAQQEIPAEPVAPVQPEAPAEPAPEDKTEE